MTSKNTDIFRITVINRQTIDGDSDTVNEAADGTFRERNGKFFIAYKNDGVTSMIKAEGDKVSVKRIGDTHSEMLFAAGKSTEFEYNTQYGAVTMNIFTEEISCALNGEGGRLKLRYLLSAGGDDIVNDMTIKVRRK